MKQTKNKKKGDEQVQSKGAGKEKRKWLEVKVLRRGTGSKVNVQINVAKDALICSACYMNSSACGERGGYDAPILVLAI